MGKAKIHNGRPIVAYNAAGKALDSEGAIIEGAPKPPKDTPHSQIIPPLTPEDRLAAVVAQAVISGNAASLIPKKDEQ